LTRPPSPKIIFQFFGGAFDSRAADMKIRATRCAPTSGGEDTAATKSRTWAREYNSRAADLKIRAARF